MADAKMKVSQIGNVLITDDYDIMNVVTYNSQSQTYTSGKANVKVLKDYMIGDNDISALGDGSVTGAILNVKSASETADSNIAETMAQNGAHNMLPFPYSENTMVRSGTTYTVATDGKVTVSGTPSADPGYSYFVLAMQSMNVGAALATKFAGKQIVVSGGDTDVVGLGLQIEGFDASNNRILYDAFIVAPKLVTVPSGVVKINVTIVCNTDYSGSSVVLEPMIKWASDKSTTRTPYAMTNGELTEKVSNRGLHIPSSADSFAGAASSMFSAVIPLLTNVGDIADGCLEAINYDYFDFTVVKISSTIYRATINQGTRLVTSVYDNGAITSYKYDGTQI